MRFCPQCGTERLEGAAACTNCGHEFLSAGDAPPASESPPPPRPAKPGFNWRDRRVLLAGAGAAVIIAAGALWSTGVFKGGSGGPGGAGVDFSLMPIAFGDKCGFVDAKGKLVINPQYTAAGYFDRASDLAPVNVGGKWGLIDRKGAYVVNPQFDYIEPSGVPGQFRVVVGGQSGTIDRKGAFIINPQFTGLGRFDAEGRAAATNGGKAGMVDKAGTYVIPPQFDHIASERQPDGRIEYFSQGLARVLIDGKWGVIDEKGKMVVTPQFDGLGEFGSNGLASFLTTRVEIIQPDQATLAAAAANEAMGNHAAAAQQRQTRSVTHREHGLIDRTGKIVVPATYSSLGDFGESDLAPAQIGELWGYIDAKGAFKINPTFAYGDYFIDGRAIVAQVPAAGQTNQRYGVIDESGAVTIAPQFTSIGRRDRNGRYLVYVGQNWGLVDDTGTLVINPIYRSLELLPGATHYTYAKPIGTPKPDGSYDTFEQGLIDKTGKVLTTVTGGVCNNGQGD